MNLAQVPNLKRVAENRVWYRAVPPRYVFTAISTTHAKTIASRFSRASVANPGFEILYLAESHLVALFEAQALFGSPLIPGGVIPNPAISLVTVPVLTNLTNIVDLSDPAQANLIGTNAQELTGDWRGYRQRTMATPVTGPTGTAPTQEFGERLFASCPTVRGFLTLSARLPYYRILAIFPQRLKSGVDSVSYTYTDSKSG